MQQLAPFVTVGLSQSSQPTTSACNPWTAGLSTFLAGAVALGAAGALAGYFVAKKPVAGAAIGVALPLAGYLYSGLRGC